MIHVLVQLESPLTPFIERHAERSRCEPGCLRFEVFERDDGRVVLHERFRDEAALAAHRATAHYGYWRKVMADADRRHHELREVCAGTQALALAAALRSCGRRIVWTNGVFDLLGPHHVCMLEEASAQGDLLIAGVNSDRSARALKAGRPIRPAAERCQLVAALRAVDLAVEFADEGSLLDLIAALEPDVLAKGPERIGERIPGQDHAGRVHFCRKYSGSTTELLDRIRS